ncbi:MAG: Agmatine deiminase [Bacteroidia bacterium]|nr:Agmatine deiminase [Bacteroidia bacterium]
MRVLYSIIFLGILISQKSIIAQDLPHYMTAEEELMMPLYVQSHSEKSITHPPLSPVRAMAEWEEIGGLCIRWTSSQQTILRQIVVAAKVETMVYIVCSDSNSVRSYLSSNGINFTNIKFVQKPSDSIWMRDYGQWNVYKNDVDSLYLIDWIYNRPRPNDDAIPSKIAEATGLPLYEMINSPNDLTHTGGNYMVDGWGTAFSSELIIEENSDKTESEIDNIMQDWMGIDRYIKMPTLPYDEIHHIDMHLKLLDEETLLVGEYPSGTADGPQIEANLQYVLSNYNSVFGTPYKVIRIPMPPDAGGDYPDNFGDYRTYTNSTFINKTLIVPTYSQQYDTTALRILRQALPGYSVVGINCNNIINQLGALHCITKEIGTNDPLLITHQPLQNTTNTTIPYQVNAWIKHKTGIQTATLYYSTDTTQGYQTTSMNLTDIATDTWTGFIPPQTAGTEVFYYIHAQANSGKQQVRPITAPDGWWRFEVTGFTTIVEEEIYENEILNVYPNPSSGITCIPVKTSNEASGKLLMADMLGREIKTIYWGTFPKGGKNYFIDTAEIEAGSYLIILHTETGSSIQKLMVK